ncbi:Hsp20/alpha crystallin family protein [Natrinema pallidum]|uniref:Heat shock protein Hsp20 n=2 Tax=Natrinema pallidum TaxID=69527 RepID=L9YEY1_9EURY|nr:Hsp20/alpha crystallin family protein [Natrinema pallidum]ELY72660.1 heat shock protein Hsp20 [Natrinema pallidum DSM 3751]QCW04515.1 Hsp20/alpha crystallin family protein [Natrinema pallidum]
MSLKELGKSVGNMLYRQIGRANGRVQSHRSLPVDILENDTSYRVVFDAPGAEPDDVQVRYLDGHVKIRIDRFRQFHEGYERRFPGRGMSLNGEAELPPDAVVDPDAGTARLSETGTLRVELPKGSSVGSTAESGESEAETDRERDSDTETEPVAIDD